MLEIGERMPQNKTADFFNIRCAGIAQIQDMDMSNDLFCDIFFL